MDLEASFAQLARLRDVTAFQRRDREAVQQHGNAMLITKPFVFGEAFFPQPRGNVELPGEMGGAAERSKRASTKQRWCRIRMLEERAVPTQCLLRIAEHPELLQRDEELETKVDLLHLERPGQGGA